MSRRLRIAAVAAAALSALLAVAPAAVAIPDGGAGADTPGTSASVSPRTLRAGAVISFTVSGFPAGQTVNVKIDDGTSCTQAAVHGACVYHVQKIPSSGTVHGSFQIPADLKPGAHWLRFLASEPVIKDGEQVGVNGFTARGDTDFTIVTGASAASRPSSSAAPPASTAAAPGPTAAISSPSEATGGASTGGTTTGSTPSAAPYTTGAGADRAFGAGAIVTIDRPSGSAAPSSSAAPSPAPAMQAAASSTTHTDGTQIGIAVTVLSVLAVLVGALGWLLARRRA